MPNYFTNNENQYVYTAICELSKRGIKTVDSYNIIEVLSSEEKTQRYADELSIDKLNELIEMSDILARNSIEEYKLLVNKVINLAFRRTMYKKLRECQALCYGQDEGDIRKQIYSAVDNVMTEFSNADDIPAFSDMIDEYWEEIESRQADGYAGIKFKFDTLNEYATIEPGELFIFAAEAKQGKSMILLNCAMDLLRQNKKVLYIDSELNSRMFTARVLAHLSGVEYKKVTSGCYTPEEKQKILRAKEWMKTKSFTHIYMPSFDQESVYTTVQKIKHRDGCDCLIIDYFKSSEYGNAFDSYQELGKFVDMVKNEICGGLNIAGIGAAQATSTGKVADSAKIGRNASTIALIQNKTPEEIQRDGEECGNKKLTVVLNRNGMQHAPGEYIDLWFQGNNILYKEAKQHAPYTPY